VVIAAVVIDKCRRWLKGGFHVLRTCPVPLLLLVSGATALYRSRFHFVELGSGGDRERRPGLLTL
jgi:hypothetical protein